MSKRKADLEVSAGGIVFRRVPDAPPITLLHPREYNYYELLRSKLNWGRASRDQPNGRR